MVLQTDLKELSDIKNLAQATISRIDYMVSAVIVLVMVDILMYLLSIQYF